MTEKEILRRRKKANESQKRMTPEIRDFISNSGTGCEEINVGYVEPSDYISKEARKKFKIGEFAPKKEHNTKTKKDLVEGLKQAYDEYYIESSKSKKKQKLIDVKNAIIELFMDNSYKFYVLHENKKTPLKYKDQNGEYIWVFTSKLAMNMYLKSACYKQMSLEQIFDIASHQISKGGVMIETGKNPSIFICDEFFNSVYKEAYKKKYNKLLSNKIGVLIQY